MEQRIVNIVLRWMWLLVLAAVGAGLASYWYWTHQPVTYEASVRLIVGPGVDGLSPDLNDLRAGSQLMETYSELATTRPILQSVIEDVGLEMSPDLLRHKLTVRENGDAQILTVFVQDDDPVRSAAIANSVAHVLLRLSPSGGESPAALIMGQIQGQAGNIEENITTIEERMVQLEANLQAATTAQEQQMYIDQLAQERARLAESRATLAVLLESLINSPTNQVKIVEPAIIGEPVSQSLPLVVLIGSAAGLLLAALSVLGYEYLDTSIRNADELEEVAGASVMSTIVLEDEELYGTPASLVVRTNPQSQVAEEYWRLATKLPLLTHENPLRRLVLSGLDNRAGAVAANEVAANLAIVLARTGMQVLLVDANLTHPTAHTQFDLSTSRGGLTDLLYNRTSSPQISLVSEIPGLSVLTSGRVSYDAFSDLASPKIRESFDDLQSRVDVVVVAAPPMSVAASLFLAAHADGMLLVAEQGHSSYDKVEEALSNIGAIDVRLLGTVLTTRKWGTPIWLRKLVRALVAGTKRVLKGSGRGLAWTGKKLTTGLVSLARHGGRLSVWGGRALAAGTKRASQAAGKGLAATRAGLAKGVSGVTERARGLNVRERSASTFSSVQASVKGATGSLATKVGSVSVFSDREETVLDVSAEETAKDGGDTPLLEEPALEENGVLSSQPPEAAPDAEVADDGNTQVETVAAGPVDNGQHPGDSSADEDGVEAETDTPADELQPERQARAESEESVEPASSSEEEEEEGAAVEERVDAPEESTVTS